jgi:putative intracellular protease/amidase
MPSIAKVLMPLPGYGFDPTEAAIPWQILTGKNIEIVFATPSGQAAQADKIMLTGEHLGIWGWLLKARKDAVTAYQMMAESAAFKQPIKYEDISADDFDALLLPGGHDKGVREYLESKKLQSITVDFFKASKPVGAICHGTVLTARSIDPVTGHSVLYNYKTTSLLKSQELGAYNLTRLWLKDYYLTYPGFSVEDEVKNALCDNKNFVSGPSPVLRDDLQHLSRGFALLDKNYLSARWPGDAYNFVLAFLEMLMNKQIK